MSLIKTDIAEKRGAIKVPNTPGWNIKFIIELNGEESEITYPSNSESLKTTKLSITCIILSM